MKVVRRLAAKKHLRVLQRARDADEHALEAAKSALRDIGPAILPELFELLSNEDAREPVNSVLASMLTDETLDTFVQGLEISRPSIADGIATLLCNSSGYTPERLLDYLEGKGRLTAGGRTRLENVLRARAGSMGADALITRIDGTTRETRSLVFRLLETREDAAARTQLRALVSHEDWWVQTHALKLLARFGSEQEIPVIRGCLEHENKNIRWQAVKALGDLEASSCIPELCKSLRDPDLKVHTAAIEALVNIGDAAAVPYLVDVLKDESEYTRRGAVEVLNEVATPDAIRDLVRALHDEDWWVRVRAADALGSLGGEKVVDAILELISCEDDFIRRYAVEILNSIPSERSVPYLIGALDDEDWWVRERSIDALGNSGCEDAVGPLCTLLLRDLEAAPHCLRALSKLKFASALPALVEFSAYEMPDELRRDLADALAQLRSADLSEEQKRQLEKGFENLGVSRRARAVPMTREVRRSKGAGDLGGPEGAASEPDPSRHEAPAGGVGKLPHTIRASKGSMQLPDRDGAATPRSGGGAGGAQLGAGADSATPAGPGTPGRAGSAGRAAGAAVPPGSNGPSNPPANAADSAVGAAGYRHGYLELTPETVLMGRFRICRRIGAGGFGSVYLVEDRTVGEELILKILHPHVSMDETMIRRFVHELKYTRKITHANVIRLYDFLDLGDTHAISMEYFASRDLGSVIRTDSPMEPGRALAITRQICEGLDAAHASGLVHRDVKPPNVLVNDDDLVKIVDFGLASMSDSGSSRLTKSGILIGTPHYMAPEQISGGQVDARTDLYSMGVLMYEMFSGELPFSGESAVNILFQHLQGTVKPLRELVPALDPAISEVVESAMARAPEDRPASAGALLERLNSLAA